MRSNGAPARNITHNHCERGFDRPSPPGVGRSNATSEMFPTGWEFGWRRFAELSRLCGAAHNALSTRPRPLVFGIPRVPLARKPSISCTPNPSSFEDLLVVLSDFRRALCRTLATPCTWMGLLIVRLQISSGALKRDHDVVRPELRIFDDFARSPHDAECEVTLFENFHPVRHRLRGEQFVQNRREIRRIRRCFAGSANRGSVNRSGRPIPFARAGQWSGVRTSTNQLSSEARYILMSAFGGFKPIMQREERGVAKRGLNEDAAGPDSRSEKRRRDVRTLSGALAPVEGRDNRRKQSNSRRVVSAARWRERRWSARIAGQRQQAGSRPIGSDIESWEASIGSLFAVTSQVRINQPRIPLARHPRTPASASYAPDAAC